MTDSPTLMAGGFDLVGRKFLERQANTTTLPAWQRTAFYCWSHCRRDNHCPLPSGGLAAFLGCEERIAARNVKKAVEAGWLSVGSNVRCLVAPMDVQYKAGNYVAKDCPNH